MTKRNSDGYLNWIQERRGTSESGAAVRIQFTGVDWQRCWTHFMHNMLGKMGRKHKTPLAKELKAAGNFGDKKTCLMEAEYATERWEKDYPSGTNQIHDRFEETLAVYVRPLYESMKAA